jgi:predicted N-acetyltransferase YhbS
MPAAPTVRIEHLADHPQHLAALAAWHQAQFGYLNTSVTVEQRMERLRASAQKGKLPMTFVAVCEGQLLGSASLLPQTITHSHLSPWLSSVYVAPDHRNKGIGSALVRHVVQEAAGMGMDKVYLFTPNSEALYARLGWKALEHTEYQGHRLTIMCI